MSHTLELLSEIEHGTVAGYRAGCHGSAATCGAEVSCVEVFTRYQGDWGFRKRVDAGETPAEIIAAELADLAEVRARDTAANREAKREGARAAVARERKRKPPRERQPRTDRMDHDELVRLHALGWSDVRIGAALGFSAASVGKARRRLDLPLNRKVREPGEPRAPRAPRPPAAPSQRTIRRRQIGELHAEGLTDNEIAERLGVTRMAVSQVRSRLGLTVNPDSRAGHLYGPRASAQHRDDLQRLHGLGRTDREIAQELGVSSSYVGDLRRQAGLTANRPANRRWEGIEKQGHGTNACHARGCRCAACVEAHREYMRDYRDRRREAGAGENHGTAYGYQLGCRGKGCPSTPSCTDAMLEQDRARRRAAGVQEKSLVDAAPVRAHLRDLKAAGMTGERIAEAAGVPHATVKSVLHSRGADRPPVATMLAERAAALLALGIPESA
ncbi:helix-turn-helix domain-containing protein [Microbacterium sp. NPDC089696]|uniref:helix-turn-helix domain-containing protein n=1 Tax=Microbacterium sp. NPDC089696 TaxID=3364199 RepID=UPI00382167CF